MLLLSMKETALLGGGSHDVECFDFVCGTKAKEGREKRGSTNTLNCGNKAATHTLREFLTDDGQF